MKILNKPFLNLFLIIFLLFCIILLNTSFIFASQTIYVKDYIKGKFPVIYNVYLASLGELDEYEKEFIDLTEIIKNRDYEAAKWVLEIGLFMEDKSISKTEKKFIDTVQNKPDLLRILVTRNVLDGITSSDLKWVKNFNPPNSKPYGYLTDDLYNLPEIKDGISDDEKKAIQEIEAIINDSIIDYQLRKGICLVDEYGVPNQNMFSFNVPNYNTQLQALFHLVKNRNVVLTQ